MSRASEKCETCDNGQGNTSKCGDCGREFVMVPCTLDPSGMSRENLLAGNANLREKLKLAQDACCAAIKYDEAIRRRADNGDFELDARGAIAEGHDLDALYEDWMTKARAAVQPSQTRSYECTTRPPKPCGCPDRRHT